MPAISGFVDFNPESDIHSLKGKVILITGGTAGLGRQSVQALAQHGPEHIYFTGRNKQAGETLIAEIQGATQYANLTFIQMDLSSMAGVKAASRKFIHNRLDILMCNAGIMDVPPELSVDGFEIHFATNHLGHAMLIRELLLVLQKTAEDPNADVRIVILSSVGWRMKPSGGVTWSTITTKQDSIFAAILRYGQSKFANIVYAKELARRYPSITSVSVHPGAVETGLVMNLKPVKRRFVYVANWLQGKSVLRPIQGRLSSLWAAAGAKKSELINGGYYEPVGVLGSLDFLAEEEKFGKKLWDYTQEVMYKIE